MEALALLLGSLLVRGSAGVTVEWTDTNHKHSQPKVAGYTTFWPVVQNLSPPTPTTKKKIQIKLSFPFCLSNKKKRPHTVTSLLISQGCE